MSENESAAAEKSLWEWLWAIAFWLTRIVGGAVVITVCAIWPSTPVVVVVVVVAVLGGIVQHLIGLQRGKE
jgi:formate-dependent nitrite reductase membrane component NrfD